MLSTDRTPATSSIVTSTQLMPGQRTGAPLAGLVGGLSPIGNTTTPPRRPNNVNDDSPQWTDDELFTNESFIIATQAAEGGDTPKAARRHFARRLHADDESSFVSPVFNAVAPSSNLAVGGKPYKATESSVEPNRQSSAAESVSTAAVSMPRPVGFDNVPQCQMRNDPTPLAKSDALSTSDALFAVLDAWEGDSGAQPELSQELSLSNACTVRMKQPSQGLSLFSAWHRIRVVNPSYFDFSGIRVR